MINEASESVFFISARFYFNRGNDSCSHLPFTVVSRSGAKIYANQFHNKSNYSATKREIWFKHAYITDVFLFPPAHALSISVGRLITALFITVVFGNFSAFQPVEKKADGCEPSGMTTLTAVTLTKIPPASHVTWTMYHQVTLYRGRGTLYTCDIKGSLRAFSSFWLRISSDSVFVNTEIVLSGCRNRLFCLRLVLVRTELVLQLISPLLSQHYKENFNMNTVT